MYSQAKDFCLGLSWSNGRGVISSANQIQNQNQSGLGMRAFSRAWCRMHTFRVGLDTNISKNGLKMFSEILQKSSKYLVKFSKYLHTCPCFFNVYGKICLNIVYEELDKPTCCENGFITYMYLWNKLVQCQYNVST